MMGYIVMVHESRVRQPARRIGLGRSHQVCAHRYLMQSRQEDLGAQHDVTDCQPRPRSPPTYGKLIAPPAVGFTALGLSRFTSGSSSGTRHGIFPYRYFDP